MNKNIFEIITFFAFCSIVYIMQPVKGMSPVYSVPYFSGAKQLSFGGEWKFDLAEVDILKGKSIQDLYFYDFDNENKELLPYNLTNSGFLYLVALTDSIIPVLGPIGAIVFFQLLVHMFICWIIYKKMDNKIMKKLFLFFYYCNPLVIYFALFPFYYFWQVIPSVIFIYYYFDKSPKINYYLYTLCVFLAFLAFVIRPTVLFLVLGIIGYVWYKYQNKYALLGIPFFALLVMIWGNYFNHTERAGGPWHTIYIGIGAYPNPYPELEKLSDNQGYETYNKLTGEQMSASIDGTYTKSIEKRKTYLNLLKNQYLKIVKENPLLITRNAILNYFQGFSIGYITGKPYYVHLIISLTGLFLFLWLFLTKRWVEIGAISLSHISFTPYYPPIQAYYYGSILLICIFSISVIISPLVEWGLNKVEIRYKPRP